MTVHWLLKPPTTLWNITDKLHITSGSKKNLSRESCSTILLIFVFILKMEKSHISVKRFALEGWVWHDISKKCLHWYKKATLQEKRKFQNKFHVIINNKHEMQNIVIEYSDTEEGVKEIKHNQAFSNCLQFFYYWMKQHIKSLI